MRYPPHLLLTSQPHNLYYVVPRSIIMRWIRRAKENVS